MKSKEYFEFINSRTTEYKGTAGLRYKLQTLNIPIKIEGGYTQYVNGIDEFYQMVKDIDLTVVDKGIAQDNNFYISSWEILKTIPGSRTEHSLPVKIKDMFHPLSDYHYQAAELLKDLWLEFDYNPNTKLKINKLSRSGILKVNDKIVDKMSDAGFVVSDSHDPNFPYYVHDVYNLEDKMRRLQICNEHPLDYEGMYTMTFRADTPDEPIFDENGKVSMKVREYTMFDGKGGMLKKLVDPNIRLGDIWAFLMRTRSVASAALEEAIKAFNLSNNVLLFYKQFRLWQSSLIIMFMRSVRYIMIGDVKNFDFTGDLAIRKLFVDTFIKNKDFIDKFDNTDFLAWSWVNAKPYEQIIKLKDLQTGTISGTALFTTCFNFYKMGINLLAAFFKQGYTAGEIREWMLSEGSKIPIEIKNSGDDNGIGGNEEDVQAYLEVLQSICTYELELGFGTVLGLVRSVDNTANINVSRSVQKGILSPRAAEGKLKPFGALGWSIKRSISPSYERLIGMMESVPSWKGFSDWIANPEVPVNLRNIPVTLKGDLTRLFWDHSSSDAEELVYSLDLSGNEINSID